MKIKPEKTEHDLATGRIFTIVLCAVIALLPLFVVGVMGIADYETAEAVDVTVTLSGKAVTGAQGGYTRYTAFAKVEKDMKAAAQLAKDTPVWGAFQGGTAKVLADGGDRSSTVTAKAISPSGEEAELLTAGNMVILPDEKGSYVIELIVHTSVGDTQYAFNVSIVPSTWSGSEVA